MKTSNKKDRILGICSVLLSAWIIYITTKLNFPINKGDPGPKLFPYIGAGLILICGIILIIKPGKDAKAFMTKEQWKSAAIIFGIYLLFALLLWIVGFMIAVPIMLFILTLMFQAQSRPEDPVKKRVIRSLIYAIIAGALIYVAYVIGLQAKLPVGLLFK